MTRSIRAALAAAVLLAFPAFALERAEVPDKYKWNVADLYPSDAAWETERAKIAADIPELASYQGSLGRSAARLHEALAAMMGVDRRLSRLATYASMRSDEDTRVGRTRGRKQAAVDLGVKYSAAVSYLRPELIRLGADKVKAFVAADERLAPYGPWLDDVLRYAPHTLSPAEEKVAALAASMADGPSNAYEVLKDADLPYPTVTLSTGEEVRLDSQGYGKHRATSVREDRDKVFKAFFTALAGYERTFGADLDAAVKTHLFDKEAHKYGSALEAALFKSDVPVQVYEQLIADVRRNLPTLHRYLKLRKRIMGLDALRYEDLYAPLTKSVDLRFTPEEAQAAVLAATAPLGEQYQADLKRAFSERWMDVMPTTGKRSGAYSTGVYGVHPYQLENFDGRYDGLSTMAHELGHSIHTLLSHRHQPYPTADYKIFVAEVASTLNENLLLRHMLASTEDKQTRLFLLGSAVDDMRTTLFRQTMFAEFEWRIHRMADKGEPLTGEALTKLYRGLVREYYGHDQGVCAVDDLYGIEWAYIPHFYYNFYVYQYATSMTASSRLAALIRAEQGKGTAARDAYLRMLSAGSSKPPLALLKDAGVDMTTSAPFDAAMREMNELMDEIEKLL